MDLSKLKVTKPKGMTITAMLKRKMITLDEYKNITGYRTERHVKKPTEKQEKKNGRIKSV